MSDPETVLVELLEYVHDVGEPGVVVEVALDLGRQLVTEGRAKPSATYA